MENPIKMDDLRGFSHICGFPPMLVYQRAKVSVHGTFVRDPRKEVDR